MSSFGFGLSRFKDSLSEAQERREVGDRAEGCCTQSGGWSEARLARILTQPAFVQIDFVEAQEMAEFVQVGGSDLFAVPLRVVLRGVPDVFEKQNSLRGEGCRGRADLRDAF